MQIRIEIDVKPDELRRFLGLPDVAGLQDEVVRFLREKVGQAGEHVDPAAVVQVSMNLVKRTPAWRLLRTAMLGTDRAAAEAAAEAAELAEEVDPTPPPGAARKPRASARPRRPAKRAKPR